MGQSAALIQDRQESADFAALLDENLGRQSEFEGQVVPGKVVDVTEDFTIVDVGLKSEGRVPLREFIRNGEQENINIGDTVDVYVESLEDSQGEAVLSREKARREEVWLELEKLYEAEERVTGIIFGRVKGGFTVDLNGAVAFLPGSQVDIRPVRDVSPIMNTPQPFQILKMDKSRGNIVVSRRAIMEEHREEARSDLMSQIDEGMVVEGTVKNITDYGAFIDLGGVDGLLHVTDMSWKRVNHPSEMLKIGDNVNVQVIRINPDNNRISLGMKQLESDPWEGIEAKYPLNAVVEGKITNVTDYGAFVELEPGVEGLVHVSEMSWTKKNLHPNKIVNPGDKVQVMVLDFDKEKRRISLGMKQCHENPWQEFTENHPSGTELEGEVRNVTEFGLFVGLPGDIDGMVHLSDLSWTEEGEEALKNYQKGDTVKVKVLDADPEKERVALGIKQLEDNPVDEAMAGIKKGDVVTCVVTDIENNGVVVSVKDNLKGYIKKADLSRERTEQRPDRFAVGEKVDAKIVRIDSKSKELGLSIKQREIDEDKAAVEAYGSAESGASLGDILGAALQESSKPAAEPEAEAAEEKPATGKKASSSTTKKKAASKSTSSKKTKEAGDAEEEKDS